MHVVLADCVAYLGLTSTDASLRRWGDVMRHAPPTRICRAEHKLIQAIDEFDISLTSGASVLDLGAAPGGWSNVLATAGLVVDAVDPAKLDERVASHPRVAHFRQRAEHLELRTNRYDLVVNDMSLNPAESASVMCRIAQSVRPGARGVMTVKLPTRNISRWTADAASALVPWWTPIAARHLGANRQEITWLLRRSEASSTTR